MGKWFICLVFGAAAVAAYGTPIVIQPGPEGEDTYIKINDTTPHGDDVVLEVRRGIDAGGLLTARTFIRFDVSAYSGKIVDRAELRLWSVYGDEPLNPIVLQEVTNSWDESTLIWDNKPEIDDPKYYMTDAAGYYYFDISTVVYNWVTLGMPNYGMCIKFEDESGTNDGIVFHSGDNTEYPDERPALCLWLPELSVEPASVGAVKASFR